MLLPQEYRDELGLEAGVKLEVSRHGDILFLVRGGGASRVGRNRYGRLVATGGDVVTDDEIFALLDSGRR